MDRDRSRRSGQAARRRVHAREARPHAPLAVPFDPPGSQAVAGRRHDALHVVRKNAGHDTVTGVSEVYGGNGLQHEGTKATRVTKKTVTSTWTAARFAGQEVVRDPELGHVC